MKHDNFYQYSALHFYPFYLIVIVDICVLIAFFKEFK